MYQSRMDSIQILITIYTLTFILALYFLAWIRRKPLPPGPMGWPIIGNMLMMDQLNHRGLARLSDKYGGIFYLKMGFNHIIVVSSPKMARQILQAQDHIFANRMVTIAITYLTYNRADLAFSDHGPFWRKMRKMSVMKLFSRKRAESWDSVRVEVDSMVKSISVNSGLPVKLGELVFGLTRDIIYRAAFGLVSRDGKKELISILQEYPKLFGTFKLADFIPWLSLIDGLVDPARLNTRLSAARAALDRFIDKIIDDHLKNRKKVNDQNLDNDMVDEMLSFHSKNGKVNEAEDFHNDITLTRDNIKALIMDVMFGGMETVASAIEWVMTELMRTPEALERVHQELVDVVGLDRRVEEADLERLTYFKCVVKETLRLHPPIPVVSHKSSEETTVMGYHIPKGAHVMVNFYAINRDKKSWEDPDTFNPSRFFQTGAPDFRGNDYEFLPFGSGRRSCPGMQLGLYVMEMTLAQLLHCFTWELPDRMKASEVNMEDVFGLTAPKAISLVAIPTPCLLCPL